MIMYIRKPMDQSQLKIRFLGLIPRNTYSVEYEWGRGIFLSLLDKSNVKFIDLTLKNSATAH